MLNNKGIKINYIDSTMCIDSLKITFMDRFYFGRSTRGVVAFSILTRNTRITYLGASSYEVPSHFPSDYAEASDAVILGSYGPVYKQEYDYDLSSLEYIIFLGKSREHASSDFLAKTVSYEITQGDKVIIK